MSILRELAERANEARNFQKAFQLWCQIAREEGDAIDYCRAGLAAHNLGRWNDAWDAYQKALKIDPLCAEAMGLLGFLFRERTDGDKRTDLLQAKDWYLRALKIDRKARWLFFLGATYGQLKDIPAATKAFKEAIALRPGYEEAYLNLALLNIYECNNPREARKYLNKAIQLDPNYAAAIFNLALLSERRQPKKARELLEKAIEISPNYVEAMLNLAMLSENKDPQKARMLLQRAIDINPNYGDAHQQIGNLLYKEGQLVEAEYHFRRSLEINPKDYFAHLFLADLLAFQERDEEAEQMYRAALALPQADPSGYEFFANFLDVLERHDEANEIRAKKPA